MQREPDEDAAWRAIVDNYGERVLEDEDEDAVPAEPEPEAPLAEHLRDPEPADPPELAERDDDRFVPPTLGPTPRPPADRLIAWLGVFGAPAVLLFVVVTGIEIPRLLGWALVGAFLVGFGYLVLRMPSDPRDPWDDGAVL